VKEANEEKHSDVVDEMMRASKYLVESPLEDSYASALLKFKVVCKPFPKFLAYVVTTILNTVKEKFVRAWTNKVSHLGCRTTNIVESAHEKLKKHLSSSVGDLASCWDEIDKMLAIKLGEIQGSFGRNITVLQQKYKRHFLFSKLEGYVSRPALGFIYDELTCSRTFGFAKEYCGCVQKTSYELPCACIIAMKRKENRLFYWMMYTLIGKG